MSTPDANAVQSLEPPRPQAPITDSAWLWFALFSAVGLAALLATGGKLGRRQANIENKYQARTAVATGELQVDEQGGRKLTRGAPEYSTPEAPEIPLWPVEVILGLICAVSVVLLVRQRFANMPEKQG